MSDYYVDLPENYVDLSYIKLISRWQLGAMTHNENEVLSFKL